MFRRLITDNYKTVNSEVQATADIKRGTLVSISIDTNGYKGAKSADNAKVAGIAVRGEVVDDRVAMGLKADLFGATQDVIKTGERFGVEPLYKGDIYSTTEFDSATIKSGKEFGLLKVVDGKLVECTVEADAFAEGAGFYKEPGLKVPMLKYRKL